MLHPPPSACSSFHPPPPAAAVHPQLPQAMAVVLGVTGEELLQVVTLLALLVQKVQILTQGLCAELSIAAFHNREAALGVKSALPSALAQAEGVGEAYIYLSIHLSI